MIKIRVGQEQLRALERCVKKCYDFLSSLRQVVEVPTAWRPKLIGTFTTWYAYR